MKKLVLCVIDGLPAAALEHGLEQRRLPALRFLSDHGSYRRGVSAFPSLTPVCLSSIATGAGPDVHGIPHLVWYHRGDGRIIEYGSSLAATMAAGVRATLRDSVVNMTREHLAAEATTVFEALEDDGLVTAAVNFTCYRGRERHRLRLPGFGGRGGSYSSVLGPRRFFFFNLYESDDTGAPLAVRSRSNGSVDSYAVAVGRWLVTRDGFDFLLYYLPDYDYAAHAFGPEGAAHALERADAALAALMDAAGGPDEFLDRYAIVVCSDHGQSRIEHPVTLERAYADLRLLSPRRRSARAELAVTASNRAAMVYRLPGCRPSVRELAERLDGVEGVDAVLFRESDHAVVRRERAEAAFAPVADGFEFAGDGALLDPAHYPDGLRRAWQALGCGSAGEVLVSAAPGYEFTDLGGGHHAGGGSHGSLHAEDSLVPVLAVGLETGFPLDGPTSITDLAPLAAAHFHASGPVGVPGHA